MADQDPSGAIGKLVDHLFTGGPEDAVVAILVLVVILCGVVCWQMYKRLMASEAERVKNSEDYAKALKDLNAEYQNTIKDLHTDHLDSLREMNSSYQKFIQDTTSAQAESLRDVSEALSSVQVTIGEMKTLVSIIGMRGAGNGKS